MESAQDTHQTVTLIMEHATNAHITLIVRMSKNQTVIMEGALKVCCVTKGQTYLPELKIQTFE